MRMQLRLTTTLAALLVSSQTFAQPVAETSTTTAGIRFPEDGGDIPRAGMATEGGTNDGMERVDTPQGGTPTDWRKDPTPPGDSPDPAEASKDDADPAAKEEASEGFSASWGGYLRLLGQVVDNDSVQFIGRNDGFRVGNARVEMDFNYGEDLGGRISFEAVGTQPEDANDPLSALTVEVRDAYLDYDLANTLSIRAGRMKVPYDLADWQRTAERVFIDLPVESRGVLRSQGFERRGMAQARQIGLMLHREALGLDGFFDVGFALALTNGRTDRLALNDNDRPAGFARMSMLFGEDAKYGYFNVAGFVDIRTVGDFPNRFDEEVKGAEASLVLSIAGLRLEAQGLMIWTDFKTTGVASARALGIHAQWSYRWWNLEAGYRFAYFDENTDFVGDKVIEHTVGLNYYTEALPLKFSLNGTFADEDMDIANNRLDFMGQFIF